jgi:hypothetical protein
VLPHLKYTSASVWLHIAVGLLMFWLGRRRLRFYRRGRFGQLRAAIQRERKHNRRVVHRCIIRTEGGCGTAQAALEYNMRGIAAGQWQLVQAERRRRSWTRHGGLGDGRSRESLADLTRNVNATAENDGHADACIDGPHYKPGQHQ